MNKTKGNMYDWVMPWNPLAGECPHKCVYCSTKSIMFRPSCKKKYSGELRLDENAMKKPLGKGNTWFVCAQNDLFAQEVPQEFIHKIIRRCKEYPENTYVFQSKNPERMFYIGVLRWPEKNIVGTTIETNRHYLGWSVAPETIQRAKEMVKIQGRKFVTIEPIFNFDIDILTSWIAQIKPEFVNIGADSKKHNLPEPSPEKIKALISELSKFTEVRLKSNLKRLLP
jgi:hypothetical protein